MTTNTTNSVAVNKELLQSSVALLMSAANYGIKPFIGKVPTPNRLLCVKLAQALYEAANLGSKSFSVDYQKDLAFLPNGVSPDSHEYFKFPTMQMRWSSTHIAGDKAPTKSMLEQLWVSTREDQIQVNSAIDVPPGLPSVWRLVVRSQESA